MKLHKKMLLPLTAAALLLTGFGAMAAEVELKVHHFLPPPSTAHSQFIEPWAEKVMKESNGRISIKIYPAMQLGGKVDPSDRHEYAFRCTGVAGCE